MKHKILLIALIISGYFGCEDLERKNPVDSNVDIIAPTNLQLSQQNIHTVLLSWSFSGDKYDGFLIDRKIGSDSLQIAYDTVANEIHSYTDTSAVPTESHTYRIYAYADENQSSSISKDITLIFPAPENLQLTQLSDTTVGLQWQDKSDGEDGFIINRKKDSGTWETGIKKTTATTWTDSTVSPGSAYSYQVKAYKGIKTSTAVESQYQNIFQAPSNLSATAIDDQSLRLNWMDNCGFESGYRVERNDGGGFIQITELNANVTTYKDEGLTYGQSYSYRIKTYTSQNESGYSNEIEVTTIFAAPSDLSVTTINDQSLQLTWIDDCSFESGFRIERDDCGGFIQIGEVTTDVTTYTDNGLIYGQTYTYRVNAFTNRNESNYSNESSSVKMIIPAPTTLTATQIDDHSLRLSWTDNCTFELGFRIERNDVGGFIQIAEVTADVVTYTDNGLTYEQNYTYQVKAFTERNESDYSNEFQAIMEIPAPTNLAVTIIDEQSMQLTWEDNCAFEVGYKVECKKEGSTFTEIADLNANTVIYTDIGLTYGQNYIYRVKAFTDRNESDYSEEVLMTIYVVVDYDGNVYIVVKIGEQYWMTENLKVTHYRNGDAIPNVTNSSEWDNLTTGAYCEYDNNPSNVATYGRLYNWYAVDRNIAPEGWHIPSDNEWQTLVDYLGGASVAGVKMKETGTTHWNIPNTGATNESGFSALPGGMGFSVPCQGMGNYAYFLVIY